MKLDPIFPEGPPGGGEGERRGKGKEGERGGT